MDVRVQHRERLEEREAAAVLALVEAATAADGVRPLDEHVMIHLRHGGENGARDVLLYAGGELAGYAHVDPGTPGDPGDPGEDPGGELVVHPAFRKQGHGRRLLRAVLEETGGRLRLWAHGGHPGAEALAHAEGLEKVRELWQMRRPLAEPIPDFTLPEGVRLRAFDPESDAEAWVALNARAFAHHPEQGAWTLADLRQREREPWFDPAGFFLAVRGDRPVGFHWTKVHAAGEQGDEPVGEVYVVGVDPGEQGAGLGRSLTLAGLAHLRSLGLSEVMLYVDESNTWAVRLYRGLGFTRSGMDVMYRR
ncbi:mycothiol synthase [Planomonospora corallina]|uniref:Mycothiol acetyltransferase n=1 Tax=Planomonospora corallina TaxID=1806052 RepID=A0ABV8IAL1_9ACTN